MKSYVSSLAVLVVLATGALVLLLKHDTQAQPHSEQKTGASKNVADLPEPPPGAIVFDMKYRGLSGRKDDLRYNSFWGFGKTEKDKPFLETLKKKEIGELHPVYHPDFCDARKWSAVEVKNGEPVAFYFDLNADGKASDNEKILPAPTEKTQTLKPWEFVTPDFLLNTAEGKQVPFRTLLRVQIYGSSTRLNCMWSPSCVLEGTTTFDGTPTKLVLYSSGFDGSFQQFGRSSYSLGPVEKQTGRDVSRSTLSSLVNCNGQYYRMKLQGDHLKGSTIRAILEKYTGGTGNMAVRLIGNTELKSKLSRASLTGSKDDTIRLKNSDEQSKLPAEAYRLTRGYMDYGKETPDLCQARISEGPEFQITEDKTCIIELGKPVLAVRAIDESQRYHLNAEEKSVFSNETNIHLSAKIIGKAGERYDRFSQRPDKSQSYKNVAPTIRIVDSKGKQVASARIEYG